MRLLLLPRPGLVATLLAATAPFALAAADRPIPVPNAGFETTLQTPSGADGGEVTA
jgi:hypothetical protein